MSLFKTGKKPLFSLLLSTFVASTATPAAYAVAPEDLGVVPGTVLNFMDYFRETLEEVKVEGGDTRINMPQYDDSPGLGPVTVLPEFLGNFVSGPAFRGFYLFEVPTLPFEWRGRHYTPEIPTINRTVVGITEANGFTKPHIPPLRWSADARLGVESQVGGSLANPGPVKLYLLAPEKLNKPFIDSAPGPQALALDEVELPFSKVAGGRTGSIQHTNICDPYVHTDGNRRNPYQCGIGGEDDCYDVTLVSSYVRLSNEVSGTMTPPKLDDWDRLMGTPLHVRVTNPKTPNARIAEVRYGEPSFTPNRTGILFETITPADGRLMIARRGFLPLVWRHTETGETMFGSYDVVYAVAPEQADPCDVSHWGDIFPITHAPYDTRVNQRYLFAKYPFRDPGGNLIPDGVDIKGTYPWMDKEAKMLSVQVSPAKLFPTYSYDKNPLSRYPVSCVDDAHCNLDDMVDTDNSKDNMFAIIGGWTQGKMVLLDGLLNDVDFRLGGRDVDQSYLSLYEPGTDKTGQGSGDVRIGSTRGPTIDYPVRDEQGQLLGTYQPANLSMFDSIENRLNYRDAMKPTGFNDVIWLMSSGHSTEELAFDDYLNPDGFIVSNMVAHLQHKNNDWYRMFYFDGWHQFTRSFNAQVRVQNSATALPERWQIPSYGRVYNGRMEPVANGGIRGKGMWFNGRNTRIDYEVPEQPRDVAQHDWVYSLFLDPRFGDDSQERLLVGFPDGSHITLAGLSELRFYDHQGKRVQEVGVRGRLTSSAWHQLAFTVERTRGRQPTQDIRVFLNGYLYHQWQAMLSPQTGSAANFRPTAGKLRLGFGPGLGKSAFKGWLDEFKVFAREPDLESLCNLAHGTLLGIPDNSRHHWGQLADSYPALAHDAVTRELTRYGMPSYSRYACYHDYSRDDAAHLQNIPPGTVSLRAAIHFPEGPLYHDAPRPDSTNNRFCLSCHHDEGIGGLTIDALRLRTDALARDDHRRQPTQPPARLYGNIPPDWLGRVTDPGNDSISIDRIVLPASAGVGAQIRNLALATPRGNPVRALDDQETLQISALNASESQIRVNVNGLVVAVDIDINGTQWSDREVPFTVPTDLLHPGRNEIIVNAQSLTDQTRKVFHITVNP